MGGIAVALAAQRTLENVISRSYRYFDQTIHLGDLLKLADTIGTVEAIGFSFHSYPYLGWTILSVPNGQIANATLAKLVARDKSRFIHVVGVEYGDDGRPTEDSSGPE